MAETRNSHGLRALLAAALSALSFAGCVAPDAPGRVDHTWRVTPFVEFGETAAGGRVTAVRPLYSRETRVSGEEKREQTDVLWPIGSFHRMNDTLRWRFFPAFGEDYDVNDPDSRWNFWLLPFYFQGRTHDGDDYWALFPLYGEIRDFLTLDRVRFELFPLHATYQRSDVAGEAWLWPIYRRRKGNQVDQISVFPIYGRYIHTGSEEFTRHYICWPLWSDIEMRGPYARGDGFVLFPLYGQIDLDRQKTRMFIPPFFSRTTGVDGYSRLHAPWPFVQIEDSPKRTNRSFWPIAGWSETADHSTSRWYGLWPIFGGETVRYGDSELSRFYANPFFYTQSKRATKSDDGESESPDGANAATEASEDSAAEPCVSRVWPLYSHRSAKDGSSLTRVPELYPLGRHDSVERNWAPLWSLYLATADPAAGTRTELLWGIVSWGHNATGGAHGELWPLFDFDDRPEHTAWSLLKGFIGRDTDGRFRFLWFFHSSAERAEDAAPRSDTDSADAGAASAETP